jgi:hypothetical protein
MKDFAGKVTQKAKTGIDSAGSMLSKLPIIGDYNDKERRREVDRQVREGIAVALEASRKRIVDVEKLLLRKGKLSSLPYVDVAAIKLQTLVDRVKSAPSGYAGFFALEKIREPEIEKLQAFDERIAASIPEIQAQIDKMQGLIDADEDYSESLGALIQSLNELNERLDHRKEAIRAAGDDVPELAESTTLDADKPSET